jgi:hypothetical protein
MQPGDLPREPGAMLDDLLADDLRLVSAQGINASVLRLEFERDGRRVRAKWKPMGLRGSEVQEGFDGNNAPRVEVAAWRLNRLLFGQDSTEHHLVAPVVVRAFHRDVPCTRACAHLPRLPGLTTRATFPALNDHLVLGALTGWIDDVVHVERFHGGLWDPERFERSARYRRSFSDLCLFLTLIAHGDANYSANFLLRSPGLDRLYSIDNGRALDGVAFYTGEGDPDWEPFAHLAPDRLVAPRFARATAARLAALDAATLQRELRVVAAVDLASGRVLREPSREAAWGNRPLHEIPGLVRHGRGVFTARIEGVPWVLLTIGEPGLSALSARIEALRARLGGPEAPLFDEASTPEE